MSTVKYNFIVSGHEVGPIVPNRGLRQGDPISPYLFLLCAEGLSALIQKKQASGALHGCKIANSAPIREAQIFPCFPSIVVIIFMNLIY